LSKLTAPTAAGPIDVMRYTPEACPPGPVLFVFAGYERNADAYVRAARKVARRLCATVYAPHFDAARFPRALYQRAGVRITDGRLDLSACVGPIIDELIDWVRRHDDRSAADVILFGHSAGAQLLSRLTAYWPLKAATHVVVANPSVHVLPSITERIPYGFRLGPGVALDEHWVREYIARPLTIYLGTADTGDKRLVQTRAARRQGAHRLDRGRNAFAVAEKLALENGWKFGWRLIEAPGVGHSGRGMLRADIAATALAPVGAR
jgi:hypothetical protein